MSRANGTGILIAALMLATSISAVAVRPGEKVAISRPSFSFDTMIPKHFGDWTEEPKLFEQVIDPRWQREIELLYDQTLSRTYVNSDGYRIMLSLAYGSNQMRFTRAHTPKGCYPAQGFRVDSLEPAQLATSHGEIPAHRMFATRGKRVEPVTYWVTVGDEVVKNGAHGKLVELRYTLRGRIPDGLVFRVSSIDSDQARANDVHDQFISQLLDSVSEDERKQLAGLGEP